jgi:superoxide reductase
MTVYICSVCGLVEFKSPTDKCPVCFASKEKFIRNDALFEESEAKSKEAAVKHIPSIIVNKKCGLIPEQSCTDIMVRIGSVLHPMEEKHFIVFIDCYVDDVYVSRMMLTPGVSPAGCFHLRKTGAKVRIVENCNIHGYWQAEASIA